MCPRVYCDYLFLKTCTLVTEANATFLTVLDNDVIIPVPVEYSPKSIKAKQVKSTTSAYSVDAQTCAGSLQQCTSEHILDVASAIECCTSFYMDYWNMKGLSVKGVFLLGRYLIF